MNSLKTSPDIDYEQKFANHSTPLYSRTTAINNVQSLNLSLSSVSGPTEFVIQNRVLNISKSKISFDITVPAQAASTYAWLNANGLCAIDRLVLQGQSSGVVLADIANVNKFASILSPLLTSQAEMSNKSSPCFSTTAGTVPTMFTSLALAQASPLEDLSRVNSNVNPDGLGVDYGNPYGNTSRKLLVSTATATANHVSFEFDLSSIVASFFDCNKLLYFNEQLLLSVYWSSVNRFAWGGTSATAPQTGAIAPTGTFVLSNPVLTVYQEQNLDIVNSLMKKVMTEGHRINFAYPIIQKQTLSSGAWNLNSQISKAYGSKCLFVAFAVMHPTESNNTSQSHSIQELLTAGGGSYSALNYQTFMNSQPIISNQNISIISSGTIGGEHYLYNKRKLRNSACQTLGSYNIDFAHFDSFVDEESLVGLDYNVVDGLSLDSPQQYSISWNGTAGATVSHNVYVIIVCAKTLQIGAQGMMVV